MKAIKKISILFLSLVAFYACNDEQLDVDNWDGNATTGGLLDIENTAINYVVGNPGPYTATVGVNQGAVKTTSVRISKTFYTTETVVDPITLEEEVTILKSNTIDDFKTIAIADTDQSSVFSYTFTFTELIEGLSIDGSDLSTNDGDYTIGDYWELTYYSTSSNGEHQTVNTTQATVSTRFAGVYNVIAGEYWRLGDNTDRLDWWVGSQVTIKSIDATTYEWSEWGILAGWTDNTLYFQIDPNTLEITYPEEWNGVAQTLNAEPLITLQCCASDVVNAATKTETPDQATMYDSGADTLDLVYGYYTAGSGPREFYTLLEKVVE